MWETFSKMVKMNASGKARAWFNKVRVSLNDFINEKIDPEIFVSMYLTLWRQYVADFSKKIDSNYAITLIIHEIFTLCDKYQPNDLIDRSIGDIDEADLRREIKKILRSFKKIKNFELTNIEDYVILSILFSRKRPIKRLKKIIRKFSFVKREEDDYCIVYELKSSNAPIKILINKKEVTETGRIEVFEVRFSKGLLKKALPIIIHLLTDFKRVGGVGVNNHTRGLNIVESSFLEESLKKISKSNNIQTGPLE